MNALNFTRAKLVAADPDASTGLRKQAKAEITAMLKFAWSRGMELPVEVRAQLGWLDASRTDGEPEVDAAPLAMLADLHARLSHLVSPAMPGALQLLDRQSPRNGWRAFMVPVDNVQWLLMAALAFMMSFVAISMCSALDDAIQGDIYTLDGERQMIVMGFLLSAAGIGGTFQALFTAQRYVVSATYDSRYDASYWILIALGLIAGLLLSVLVPVRLEGTDAPTLAKPVLALLGGFSSGLVYRILQRLVDTIDSLFQAPNASK